MPLKNTLFLLSVLSLVCLCLSASPLITQAQDVGEAPAEADSPRSFELDEILAIESVGAYGRNALYADAIVAELLQEGEVHPMAGGEVTRHDGEVRTWSAQKAEKGRFENGNYAGGYILWQPELEAGEEGIYLLDARGHVAVYVNGEVRGGDPYGNGRQLLPVELKAGVNQLLFHNARGRVSAKLDPISTTANPDDDQLAQFSKRDATMPSVVVGADEYQYGAMPIINVTRESLRGLSLRIYTESRYADGTVLRDQTRRDVPALAPLSARKQPFTFHVAQDFDGAELIAADLRVELMHKPSSAGSGSGEGKGSGNRKGRKRARNLADDAEGESKLDTWSVGLHVAQPTERFDVTFISAIDRSVQYYSVRPAIPLPNAENRDSRMGLVLSLHGASVEARGQANSYAPKRWCHVVAATNRRPFGFDWEDWGRLDALEVLAHAQAKLNTDPSRTYLTGHSMGGHGTHHVGITFPDKFAAIGPSAGWIDFWGYGGGPGYKGGSLAQDLLDRAANPSRTLKLLNNHKHNAIYLLHGDADDNVPISEAQKMADALKDFHKDWDYHWQPGAGHWWNGTPGAGVGCVDWPQMFDFFARHRLPDELEVREVDFTTMNPGVSSKCFWTSVLQQRLPLARSRVQLRIDPIRRHIEGECENVDCLKLDLAQMEAGASLKLTLDGQEIEDITWPESGELFVHQRNGDWSVGAAPSASEKNPARAGMFKDAFRNGMVFVYGTQGSEAESAWGLEKARFDAESWHYQGNGHVEVIADVDFDPALNRDRNVILYGNRDTHLHWDALLGEDCPIQVATDSLTIGGADTIDASAPSHVALAGVFIRPRAGSDSASVGVVTGTSLGAMRLTTRMRFFVSGSAWPDFFFVDESMPAKGSDSVRLCGYFENDWSMPSQDNEEWMVTSLRKKE